MGSGASQQMLAEAQAERERAAAAIKALEERLRKEEEATKRAQEEARDAGRKAQEEARAGGVLVLEKERVEKERDEFKARCEALERKLEDAGKEYRSKLESLEQRASKLDGQVTGKSVEVDTLKDLHRQHMDTLQREVSELQADRNEARNRASRAEKDLIERSHELSDTRTQLAGVKDQLASAQKQTIVLEQRLKDEADKHAMYTTFSKELLAAKDVASENLAKETDKRRELWEKQVKQLRTELQRKEEQLAEQEKRFRAETETIKTSGSGALKELADEHRQIEERLQQRIKEQLDAADEQLRRHTHEYEELSKRHEETSALLVQAKETAVAQQQAHADELDKVHAYNRTVVTELQDKLSDTEDEMWKARRQLEVRSRINGEIGKDLTRAQAELEAMSTRSGIPATFSRSKATFDMMNSLAGSLAGASSARRHMIEVEEEDWKRKIQLLTAQDELCRSLQQQLRASQTEQDEKDKRVRLLEEAVERLKKEAHATVPPLQWGGYSPVRT